MKTIKKVRPAIQAVEVEQYQCEICQEIYSQINDALECERRCKCEHDYSYWGDIGYELYPTGIELVKKCSKCKKYKTKVLPTNDIPTEIAEMLFKLEV